MDQVSVRPEVSVYGVQALAGDRSVTLQWQPVPNAVGYRLYRGPSNATAVQLAPLGDPPVTGTLTTDRADALVNGTVVTYGIAPVFAGAPDGPVVTIRAKPVAAPSGWIGCSINEGPLMMGNVALDPATNQITMRGSGQFQWNMAADQCYFFGRQQSGDFQVTVKALARPTMTGVALAGLMIRESLDGSARQAFLALSPNEGLQFFLRVAPRGSVDLPDELARLPNSDLKLPITLRLTRTENRITPEYAFDDGLGFRPAGEPIILRGTLPGALYVGLAATANDRTQTSQARFSDLNIQPLP
jgi:hypothetical protein